MNKQSSMLNLLNVGNLLLDILTSDTCPSQRVKMSFSALSNEFTEGNLMLTKMKRYPHVPTAPPIKCYKATMTES